MSETETAPPDMGEKEQVFVEEVIGEQQEITSTSFKRATEIKNKDELARWRQDVAQHLAGRGQFVLEAEKAQAETPRFCRLCCDTFLTAREYNHHGESSLHGCKHTCENQKVCESKLSEFQLAHPQGRVI